MSQVSSKLRRIQGAYTHWCPACNEMHPLPDSWKFNGNLESPTFNPSFKHEGWINGKPIGICHYVLTNGQLNYQGDCTHAFAGKIIPLPVLPEELRDEDDMSKKEKKMSKQTASQKREAAEERAEERREQVAEDKREDAAQAREDAAEQTHEQAGPQLVTDVKQTGASDSEVNVFTYNGVLHALSEGKVAWRKIWTDGGYIKMNASKQVVNQLGHPYSHPAQDKAATDWNVGDKR